MTTLTVTASENVSLTIVRCPCGKATNVAAPKGVRVWIFKCKDTRCGFTGTVTVS